jgi:ribonuclease HI|tara:strand:- start:6716 stop:7159 length:444 start_codon:yes stop_codon:yes gene_type:complete
MTDRIEIFTDGACKGNPGPGGWGALLRSAGESKELKGSAADTTNNRMEMQAVISALESLKQSSLVHLTTDSKYVLDGVKSWMPNWKKRGWKTASKAPVKNKDLWMQIDVLVQRHDVEWAWVKGHSGHIENERVDQLANDAIDEMQRS